VPVEDVGLVFFTVPAIHSGGVSRGGFPSSFLPPSSSFIPAPSFLLLSPSSLPSPPYSLLSPSFLPPSFPSFLPPSFLLLSLLSPSFPLSTYL
jgi:hypothetical protein